MMVADRLSTVVDIASLFIEEGPMVQIKSAGRKKRILYDKDKKLNGTDLFSDGKQFFCFCIRDFSCSHQDSKGNYH
jgi:hypothetical protein